MSDDPRCLDIAMLNGENVQCEREWDHAAEGGEPINWHRNGTLIWNTPTHQGGRTMSDDPRVTVPAELVDRLREAVYNYHVSYHGVTMRAKALVDAAERPACSHRWRAFPPDGKRYGYWRCDECGKQNEGPMCLVTTKERGVYRDPDPVSVVVPLADHPAPPPVPVSDEAEAIAAYHREFQGPPMDKWLAEREKECFIAGFNAGAAHMADREAAAWREGCLAVCNGGIDECGMSEPHMHPELNPFRLTPDTEGETDE